jgi:phospholipid N-methyltransferase
MGRQENLGSSSPTREAWGKSQFKQILLFLRNFIRDPAMVGWLMPSSRFLVGDIIKRIDWDRAKVIVEYGAGTGTFTKAILQHMRPDARLIALEINPDFYQFLSSSFQDPRLHISQESAADIDTVLADLGYSRADCVVSGIPFKSLPHGLRDSIVRKTHAVLRPRGKFLVYQVSGTVLPYLESVFGHVSRDFQLLNIIPARLFYCARA